jgi:hypothetical protein
VFAAMMMVIIVMVMMNVGMIPTMMSMPGHGSYFVLSHRSLVHEAQCGVQIDNSCIRAQSLRN